MKWISPPMTKIYEALGAVADGRVVVGKNGASVISSSGNKAYEISYDPEKRAIMSNDNGSYWKGYLGYPAIAFLISEGVIEHKKELSNLLKGIKWKDLNVAFNNDFEKALDSVLISFKKSDRDSLRKYSEEIIEKIKSLELSHLGKKKLPPSGY